MMPKRPTGSTTPAPAPLTYVHVTLAPGERWTYKVEAGHDVAWLAVDTGDLVMPDHVTGGELATFEEG